MITLTTFENFGDFVIYSTFFSKRPLSPFSNVVECKVVSIGTLLHPGATLKLGERAKFRKYSKVPMYFIQGCRNFTKFSLLISLLLNVMVDSFNQCCTHRKWRTAYHLEFLVLEISQPWEWNRVTHCHFLK